MTGEERSLAFSSSMMRVATTTNCCSNFSTSPASATTSSCNNPPHVCWDNVLMKNHPCIEQCLFHVCCIQFLQQPTHVHWDSILVKNHPCIEHFLFHVHCIHHYGGGGGVGVGDFYALGHQQIFFLTRCCMASMGLFRAHCYGRNRSFSCECFMVLKVFFSQDALWSQWVLSSHAMLYGLNRSFLMWHCMVSEGLFLLFLAVSAGLFLTGYFWTPKKLTIIVTQLVYYWWNANIILPNCFFSAVGF